MQENSTTSETAEQFIEALKIFADNKEFEDLCGEEIAEKIGFAAGLFDFEFDCDSVEEDDIEDVGFNACGKIGIEIYLRGISYQSIVRCGIDGRFSLDDGDLSIDDGINSIIRSDDNVIVRLADELGVSGDWNSDVEEECNFEPSDERHNEDRLDNAVGTLIMLIKNRIGETFYQKIYERISEIIEEY